MSGWVAGLLTLREGQRMMRELYHHHDSRRGIEATYEWLVSEVWELGKALSRGLRGKLEEEFADVLAWLLSLANLAEVDLEEVFLKRYSWRCPKCGSKPCTCSYRERPERRVKISVEG